MCIYIYIYIYIYIWLFLFCSLTPDALAEITQIIAVHAHSMSMDMPFGMPRDAMACLGMPWHAIWACQGMPYGHAHGLA